MVPSLSSLPRLAIASLLGLLLQLCPEVRAAAPAADSTAKASPEIVAQPFLSPALGSHMVLQRGKPNRFWGWSTPGDVITIAIDGAKLATATAGADGRWLATFTPPAPGGPYRIEVAGRETAVLEDVLCGDVWLCGGQSNMNYALRHATGGAEAAATADLPQLRLFRVQQQISYEPARTATAQWQVCSPSTAPDCSAVAFLFARRLQAELHIPIGIVQSAVGGSPVESWMSPEALAPFTEFAPALAEITRLSTASTKRYGSFLMHWLDEVDTGSQGEPWSAVALNEEDWKPIFLPSAFQDLGVRETPAIGWFRLHFTLPDPLPAGQARLLLGMVDKMDTTFINGRWIGASSWVENPRDYAIPEGTLHAGENVLAIRVAKLKRSGGFRSPPATLKLTIGDAYSMPLVPSGVPGEWKGRLSHLATPSAPLPLDQENYATMPAVLRHGMITPLAPLATTGAVWYQGEANFTRAWQYRGLLPALIADWRRLFQNDEASPFIIVGLPAFMQRRAEPVDDGWAELREAQALTARTVPGAALAITIDTGDANDIHPKDKSVVAERAARLALARHYGAKLADSGPALLSSERRGDALVLRFQTNGGTLVLRDEEGQPLEFALAGEDRRFRWAKAVLEGADTLVLRAEGVAAPVAVRYAWQANPRATLFNSEGLPASPFRTDDWPLSTQPRN